MAIDVTPTLEQAVAPPPPQEVRDVQQTTCCIVGGGPAGAVLGLMLAQKGIPTMLLEEHRDFNRDFRGDTLFPSVLEIMRQLGVAEGLLKVPHSKATTFSLPGSPGRAPVVDLKDVKSHYPFIMLVPQARFLDFIAAEAQKYPSFHLVMGARVEGLVEEGGEIRGVRYRDKDGWHEVRAVLTVGADGRFSRVRRLAGLEPIQQSPPLDVLWFRLPKRPEDEGRGVMGRMGPGYIFIIFERADHYQLAYSIPKRSYLQIREAGLDALRRSVAERVPEFANRVDHLQDWKQVSLLSVESNRLPRWYRPGLIMIGDAAHAMSPIGGVGINMAIQDAVVTANVLSKPLKAGGVEVRDLAKVQRRRAVPTRIVQGFQSLAQARVIAPALDPSKSAEMPAPVRLAFKVPRLRRFLANVIAFGVFPARVEK